MDSFLARLGCLVNILRALHPRGSPGCSAQFLSNWQLMPFTFIDLLVFVLRILHFLCVCFLLVDFFFSSDCCLTAPEASN